MEIEKKNLYLIQSLWETEANMGLDVQEIYWVGHLWKRNGKGVRGDWKNRHTVTQILLLWKREKKIVQF